MKLFLKIFFGLLLLVIIAVGVFVYTFDANKYKKELSELVESQFGLPVTIDGNIDISIYPWIGIKVDEVKLANPEGFSQPVFAHVGQFDLKIEIKPLIQKKLNVETLVLHNLRLNLETNKQGVDNWAGMLDDEKDNDAAEALGLKSVRIGSVDVQDANISWLDAATGKEIKMSGLKLNTEAVVQGKPLPVSLNAHFESNQPAWQATIFVKTSLTFTDDSPIFKAGNLELGLKPELPETSLEDVSLILVAQGEVNVETETAKFTDVKMSVLDLLMAGELNAEKIFSVPVIKGPLQVQSFEAQTLASQFKVELPKFNNETSLKKIAFKTQFGTDFKSINFDDLLAVIDESRAKGFVHIEDIRNHVVKYELNVDSVNLDNYLLADDGTDRQKQPLPLGVVQSSTMDGKVTVEKVTLGERTLDKVQLISKIEKSVLSVNPVSFQVGDVPVKAALRVDATKTPKVELVTEVSNIQSDVVIKPFLEMVQGKDALTLDGVVKLNGELAAVGKSIAALRKNTKGYINVTVDNPVLHGIDVDYASKKVVAQFAKKNNFRTRASYAPAFEPGKTYTFDSITARIEVDKGKYSTTDMKLDNKEFSLAGYGILDSIKKTINARWVMDLKLGDPEDIREKLRNHPMEYTVQGKLGKPVYAFDEKKYDLLVGRLLVQEARKRKIEQKKNKNSWHLVK